MTKARLSKPLQIEDTTFDPHVFRIRQIEAPVLQERNFVPVDGSLDKWEGKYKGHECTIYFPPLYPVQPLEFYWKRVPRGFHNVVEVNRLCSEQLLYDRRWTPDTTVETIFEALDTHPYFAGK